MFSFSAVLSFIGANETFHNTDKDHLSWLSGESCMQIEVQVFGTNC
jgi:hypothetical protein